MAESLRTNVEENSVARLDESLSSLDPTASIDDALKAGAGSFPTLVCERLRLLGYDAIVEQFLNLREPPPIRPGHELHQLDNEWYFTSATSRSLATRFRPQGPWVCLGTPTVALEAATGHDRVSLVDTNQTTVAEVTSRTRRVEALVADAREDEWPRNAALIVLDPPWSVGEMKRWLAVAAAHTTSQGRLLMPLPHELVRPSGPSDRQDVLRLARKLGRVSIAHNFVRYETPRFEYEVLLHQGLQLSRPWRTADLLEVEVERGDTSDERVPTNEGRAVWATYVIRGQTVKLRSAPRRAALDSVLIAHVPGCVDLMLDTVSSRDARQQSVDIWTSRNRVAQSGQLDRLRQMLDQMQAGYDLDTLTCSSDERAALRRLLDWTP